jgi:hypothetical protein
MKNYQNIIALVKYTLVFLLSMQILSGRALGTSRDETLPPGENTKRVEWIQIPFADPFHLIVCSKRVRKELGITRQQLSQFEKMEPLFRSELRELSYRHGQQSENDIQRHIDAARNGVGRILEPAQIKRLRQLLLQLHGPCSVAKDPELSALLKITEQQERSIDSILDGLTAKSSRIYTSKQKDNAQANDLQLSGSAAEQLQMQQVLQNLNDEVYKLFSDEQKEIYEKAQGKPFEFTREGAPSCLDDDKQPE